MKKIFVYFSLILLSVSCFASKVYADSETYDFIAYYEDGATNIESNFDENAVLRILSSMEPGDVATINIAVQNRSSETVDWYMLNSSESFESGKNLGGIYSYSLNYNSSSANREIYNSDKVGGLVNEQDQTIGIESATEELKEQDIILERLGPNGSGVVTMRLELNGETLDNNYQDTVGSLTVKFELEIVPKGEPEEVHHERIVYIPNTGDSINLNFYIFAELFALLLLAVIVLAYYIYCRRQENAR